MKTHVKVIGFLILWFATVTCVMRAHASTTECELIKDADQRNYCRAMASHRKSYCESIKDNDLRHRCRALAEAK